MTALEMMKAVEMNTLEMKDEEMKAEEMEAEEMEAEAMNALETTEVVPFWRLVDLIVGKKMMMLFLSIWGAVENASEFPRGKAGGSPHNLAS